MPGVMKPELVGETDSAMGLNRAIDGAKSDLHGIRFWSSRVPLPPADPYQAARRN